MIPLSWSGQSAGTGVLRTRCIGCWTSPSARMTAGCATGRLHATSPSCARSPSIWSPGTGARKPAYVAGARRLLGTTPTCSRSSHTKLMREPWVYEGIVKPDGKPSILTLNADYFLINRPIAKFLYRLARKAAGETEAFYSLPEVHRRSRSKLPPHKFRQAVEEIVADAKLDPLPDYDLILEPGTRAPVLRMRHRKRALPPSEPSGTSAS